jgi:hypothetical protein
MLVRVISGGQIGADQAGLFAAEDYGIATGGWMPRGFLTSDGNKPEFGPRFGIRTTESESYPPRTGLNCRDSDGTLRVAASFNTPGEKCTLKYLRAAGKPYHDITMPEDRVVDPIEVQKAVEFIKKFNILTLNVSGNVEPKSRNARSFGITNFTRDFLGQVFEALGHERARPPA